MGIRARNRAAIEAEILETGTRHLKEHGAAALSLRAIARDLGMASSAIYRYVASRDELLTRLIVAAYTSLGDAVDRALADSTARSPVKRFAVIGRAFRSWALAHPHQFALVYGSPVPDYQAPAEVTNPAGTRVQGRLLELVAELPQRPSKRADRLLAPMLGLPELGDGAAMDSGALLVGLHAWQLVVGAVTAELFEQYGARPFADADDYFETVLESAARLLTP